MNIMEKITNLLKGIVIFCIVYIVISGNGDDTFFAWILMCISLVLTMLFLDETKSKFKLILITLALAVICADWFGRAVLLLSFALLLVYIFVCKRDARQIGQEISLFLTKTPEQLSGDKWSAINILNPLERYSYTSDRRTIIIKKGFPGFLGKKTSYPISALVSTDMMEVKYYIIWCKVTIPVSYNANSNEPTEVVLNHITKRRVNELLSILSGRLVR